MEKKNSQKDNPEAIIGGVRNQRQGIEKQSATIRDSYSMLILQHQSATIAFPPDESSSSRRRRPVRTPVCVFYENKFTYNNLFRQEIPVKSKSNKSNEMFFFEK